jgi:hypothetical protein
MRPRGNPRGERRSSSSSWVCQVAPVVVMFCLSAPGKLVIAPHAPFEIGYERRHVLALIGVGARKSVLRAGRDRVEKRLTVTDYGAATGGCWVVHGRVGACRLAALYVSDVRGYSRSWIILFWAAIGQPAFANRDDARSGRSRRRGPSTVSTPSTMVHRTRQYLQWHNSSTSKLSRSGCGARRTRCARIRTMPATSTSCP